ncbi:arylamine N-acetyltransferase family protein [Shimazuella kribbensis]|uniref:arylamine N-acetyltransferase family protein n=1 Tax=Shimazuella kribbensis TaxID=139808 RepID=UPI00040F8458|nr:arylamine N-acetyltransferase [Shimazuella kribbensis]
MNNLNVLFRKRIGISEHQEITFETLDDVLAKTAKTIPFENLCIMNKKTYDITEENVIHKILVKKEGGLCYELNSLFYLFLIENEFHAFLARGVVYDNEAQHFQQLGKNHVTILCIHNGQTYLIDTGFGGNLPLKPVPLTGEVVVSSNGEFRVKKKKTELGDYIFEQKLKYKDKDWRIGYAFDSQKTITDISEFQEIQNIIADHPKSTFNKNPLITRLTDRGNVTLTNTSFTQWIDGTPTKTKIDQTSFKSHLEQYFGM